MKRSLPCELHIDHEVHPGTTVEITESELVVQCDGTFAPGTNVDLRIPTIGDFAELWLKAQVVRDMDLGPRHTALLVVEAPPVYKVLTMPGLEIDAQAAAAIAPAETSLLTPSTSKPVVLLDDGSLESIAGVLDSLDVEYARVMTAKGKITSWPTPELLFICPARIALSLPMPSFEEGARPVGIAVAENATQTLVRNLQGLGFRYFVDLPVHADALHLLLQQNLFHEQDKRGAPRHPVGVSVSWRSGLRRRMASLIEVSETGGRLHTADSIEIGRCLRFSVPAATTGGGELRLRGQVVRCGRRAGAAHEEPYSVGLRWEELDGRTVTRLHDFLAARAIGPASFDGPGALRASPPISPAALAASDVDRRNQHRVIFREEVVSLTDANAVEHVLVCRDLSMSGVRVDPHPSLEQGAKLRIALADPEDPVPLILDAEVVRDGAESGLGLHFADAPPDVSARLAAWIERLPALQTLQPRARRVVFGRVVERD